MGERLSPSAQRVQDALAAMGLDCQVVELERTARSAAEAAEAIGCTVGQIVKSLVFKGQKSQNAVLVAASGANRVDEKRLAALMSEPVGRADPEFVRERTGYAIGGVPPIGHAVAIRSFVDEDLLQYREIWAAAGNPNAVFRLSPPDLVRMTGGQVVQIK